MVVEHKLVGHLSFDKGGTTFLMSSIEVIDE